MENGSENNGYHSRTLHFLAGGKPVISDKTIKLSPSKLANYIIYSLNANFPDSYTDLKPKELFFKTLIHKIVNDAFLVIEKYHRFSKSDSSDIRNGYPEEFQQLLKDKEFLKGAFDKEITRVLTTHPNGFMGIETERRCAELVSLLVDAAKRSPELLTKVAAWNGQPAKLPKIPGKTFTDITETAQNIWMHADVPEKMNTTKECERLCTWISGIYDSLPDYLSRSHSARRALSPNKVVNKETRRMEVSIYEPSAAPLTPEDLRDICLGRGKNNIGGEKSQKIRLGTFLSERVNLSHAELTKLRKDDWGVPGGYVTLEELYSLNPGKNRDWTWDADGKKTTQPYTKEKHLGIQIANIRESYSNSLGKMIENLSQTWAKTSNEAEAKYASQIIATLRQMEVSLAGEFVPGYAKELEEKLVGLKTRYESYGFIFPPAVDKEKKQIPYSQLDLMIRAVNNMGDYGSVGEIRQNARENKEGLVAIGKILKNNGLLPPLLEREDISEKPDMLLDYLRGKPAQAELIRDKLHDIYTKTIPTAETCAPGQIDLAKLLSAEPSLAGDLKGLESIEFSTAIQILGLCYLTKTKPGCVSSYVIAEAATVDADVKETGNEALIRKSVVKNGLRDSRQVMLYKALTGASKEIKVTTLAEDPSTTRNKEFLYQAKLKDPYHLKEFAGYITPLKFFDSENSQWRNMTLADYKNQQHQQLAQGDEKITMFTGPEEMDAGSDSAGRGSKAMGLVISNARKEVDRLSIETPVTIQYNNVATRAVILPGRHAGIGEGLARCKGMGDHPHELISVFTCQGGGNAMKRDWVHEIITHQIAHLTFTYAQPEPTSELKPQNRFPVYLRKAPLEQPVSEYPLTAAERQSLLDRAKPCAAARETMVQSKEHDQHLSFGTNARHAALMNRSARMQSRNSSDAVSFSKLRMIGLVDMINNNGDRGTETQVKLFYIRNENDIEDGLLSPANRKELLTAFSKDIIANRLMWDSLDAFYVADYRNAWRMEGCQTKTRHGVTTVRFGTNNATISELSAYYQTGELPEGFRQSHAALAVMHENYVGAAKAVFEIFYRIKHGTFPEGELNGKQEFQLRQKVEEISADYTKIPKIIKEVLAPETKGELAQIRNCITAARKLISEDHLNRTHAREGLDDEKLYYAGMVHYLTEEFGGRRYGKQHNADLHLPAPCKGVVR